jgi:hypothetical protein
MSEVDAYIASHPESDYVQLISALGEPKVIVSQYIADADAAYLLRRIRIAKFVRIGVVAVIVAVVVAVSAVIAIKYVDYVKGQSAYLEREVTEIIK